jgi:hypothetical protein
MTILSGQSSYHIPAKSGADIAVPAGPEPAETTTLNVNPEAKGMFLRQNVLE